MIINSDEQLNEAINNDKGTLILFSADWCGPCKIIKPTLEKVEESFSESYNFIKVDISEVEENTKKFNIRKPIEYFASTIQKHTKQITERNSDFFLNNFGQIVNEEGADKDTQNEAFRLFNNLKKYWLEMPDENKKVIWDYLNVLTKLSMQFLLSQSN